MAALLELLEQRRTEITEQLETLQQAEHADQVKITELLSYLEGCETLIEEEQRTGARYVSIIDKAPTGRLSLEKLQQFEQTINTELRESGATRFVEVGHRNGYYALDEMNADQLNYRQGTMEHTGGASGVMRCYEAGLTAGECKQAMINFYYEAFGGES